MYDMLVVQSFRPDRLVASGTLFVKAALGEDFFHASEEELNLGMIVQTEVSFYNSNKSLCAPVGFLIVQNEVGF